MPEGQCFHQDLEWNYSSRFALCLSCRSTFADATYIRVRAGMGRIRWVVRSVVPREAAPAKTLAEA